MLQDLPVEVLQQITGHLPTASSIANLSQTNHKLHSVVTADDHNIYRSFVRQAFPSISTPPRWRDAAQALTSRSRAWDRRAFTARECHPDPSGISFLPGVNPLNGAAGYRPTIDSYETWPGQSWSNRKEVVAWGAASRLVIRTSQGGRTTWTCSIPTEEHLLNPENDILNARLLRPHQNQNEDGETVIVKKANRQVLQLRSSSSPGKFAEAVHYTGLPSGPFCTDISRAAQPVLAACGEESINLYPVHSLSKHVDPAASVKIENRFKLPLRKLDLKFLSDSTIAVANQLLEGRQRAPIDIYDISEAGLLSKPFTEASSISDTIRAVQGRHSANILEPLIDASSSNGSGNLLLSGWTDGMTRLYDFRTPHLCVAEYLDSVDDGAIVSILPVGYERFLAGSAQNGCLKTFDLRMTGARVYSYLDARPSVSQTLSVPKTPPRDFNIFVTPTINHRQRLWEPLSRPHPRSEKYRGPIYSLSSPSSSSPTVYVGISNHVLQLEFLSTDDIRRGRHGPEDDPKSIINLSCYERPRKGRESTDPVLLRKQRDLNLSGPPPGSSSDSLWHRDDGWDERWSLDTGRDRPETAKGNRSELPGRWRHDTRPRAGDR